ncbi:MAG: hydantoinase/oxoprolinase family protein, partial [Thermodesulfobacteriota bacterium]|nr:hydantoinase/oxoprolinase family protein [Thermodesulfobacteriota bacterium]
NPAHEVLLEKEFEKRGLPVSRSSEIIPEFREFERASTTAINAFVQPVVRAYVEKIRETIRAVGGPPDYFIMKSGGGVAGSREIYPVQLLLSGPAGGVSGGLLLGRQIKRKDMITFDMGGTSADFSSIVDNAPLCTEDGEIDNLPIRLPIFDITTIGAGGGSISWVDKGGALRVGPKSAGSEPGPACYNRGGTLPTVTDANLLSGILNPMELPGTGITLNLDRAKNAFRSLSESAGLGLEETIIGVRSVVNANMLRGIRRATVEKGIDVRSCTLLAFGGAGPIHAVELARELGIKEVLVPPMAGMFSALGILLSDVKLDFGETFIARWNRKTQRQVDRILNQFKEKALRSLARQAMSLRHTDFAAQLDMRYKGQSFHLPVPYRKETDLEESFHQTFERRYGYNLRQGPPVEIVTVRLSAVTPRDNILLSDIESFEPHLPVKERKILLPTGWRPAPVYSRKHLWSSFQGRGPLVIEDDGFTMFVPPGCKVSVEASSCLKVETGESATSSG